MGENKEYNYNWDDLQENWHYQEIKKILKEKGTKKAKKMLEKMESLKTEDEYDWFKWNLHCESLLKYFS